MTLAALRRQSLRRIEGVQERRSEGALQRRKPQNYTILSAVSLRQLGRQSKNLGMNITQWIDATAEVSSMTNFGEPLGAFLTKHS